MGSRYARCKLWAIMRWKRLYLNDVIGSMYTRICKTYHLPGSLSMSLIHSAVNTSRLWKKLKRIRLYYLVCTKDVLCQLVMTNPCQLSLSWSPAVMQSLCTYSGEDSATWWRIHVGTRPKSSHFRPDNWRNTFPMVDHESARFLPCTRPLKSWVTNNTIHWFPKLIL